MSSLRELQSQFSNAIISGTADDIYFSLFGAKEHVAVRLNVYRNNIFLGQRLALTATFPVIQRLLGEHCFNAVATAYLKEVGATSGDLNDVGADFPDYIRNHPSTATLVYLYDVAQLEWRYQRCLLAADAGALTAEALAAVASESYDALRFETHPAAILFTSNYPVLHIWLANQQDTSDEDIALDEGADHLLLMRSQLGVEIIRMDTASYTWLHAIQQGASFIDAIAEAFNIHPTFDLATCFTFCLKKGVLVKVISPDKEPQ